ncbi:hypothetical protein [Actinoplanes sp. G11-F43]|uniref:hypothetical protein n=1 Tax=Actinoplanes sp. G11-F43 TaxID=3424130 RepID=UPI003D34D2A7
MTLEEELGVVLASIARHRQRRGTSRCGRCGGPWHAPQRNVQVWGCSARRLAASRLRELLPAAEG